ncbi:DMT family transporter [Magnetovibrio sp.]|uniref:DMT family transporter n=1 Tax=Magnetovibrio sp. TaxID=2024836 RepID=UPI002F9496A3
MTALEKRAQLLTIMGTILVSTSFPIGAAITQGLDSVVLTLFRFAIAAALFGPLVAWKYGLPRPSLRDLGRYGLLSACMVGFFWAMFEALRFTSPLNTATIFTLTPTIAAGVSAVLLKERLKTRSFIALGLGMVGAVWVIFRGDFASFIALDLNRGDAIFLIGTVCIGVFGPLVKYLHRGEPMARVSFWIFATGSGWLLLLALPRLGGIDWAGVPTMVYWGVLYLALFTTLITFFVFQWSTMVIGPTKVSSYTYVQPVLVLIIGLVLGHDAPPALTYPGLVLVLGATVVLQTASARTKI